MGGRDLTTAPTSPLQVKSHVVMNCTEEDSGVKALRCKIVELMVKCKCKGRALIGVHVPPSYTQLQDLLERKARALSLAGGVPILRRAEVRRLVQENELPMEPDEMDKAVKFLHEAGEYLAVLLVLLFFVVVSGVCCHCFVDFYCYFLFTVFCCFSLAYSISCDTAL